METAPPEGAPIDEWYPWDCPECGQIWWYELTETLEIPCCRGPESMEWDRVKRIEWLRMSRMDQWRRLFGVASMQQGRRAALRAAKRIPKDHKGDLAYRQVFAQVNATLPRRLHIELDIDGRVGPFPSMPQWWCDPMTFKDEPSGLELSFQVKPESGARLLRVRSEMPLKGGVVQRSFMFTTEGKLDGVG